MEVIDLDKYKKNLIIKKELVRDGRTPLYISHLTGKVTGGKSDPEFGDRLQRIRASLEKINRLMSELKKMSEENREVGPKCTLV